MLYYSLRYPLKQSREKGYWHSFTKCVWCPYRNVLLEPWIVTNTKKTFLNYNSAPSCMQWKKCHGFYCANRVVPFLLDGHKKTLRENDFHRLCNAHEIILMPFLSSVIICTKKEWATFVLALQKILSHFVWVSQFMKQLSRYYEQSVMVILSKTMVKRAYDPTKAKKYATKSRRHETQK